MSDELRAAAERLLALAEKASAGPWKCNVDVFDEGQDIQVCVQDDAIRSLFCADSGIQPTAQVSWADAKLTQTYRDGEFVAAACAIGPQIARACLAEHPEPPAFTRDGIEALRRSAGEIDTDAVREFRGEDPADDGEAVTEEWLRAVGFVTPEGKKEFVLQLRCLQTYQIDWEDDTAPARRWRIINTEWDDERVPGQLCPKTRGDVRRLCAALGVPLAEGQAKLNGRYRSLS